MEGNGFSRSRIFPKQNITCILFFIACKTEQLGCKKLGIKSNCVGLIYFVRRLTHRIALDTPMSEVRDADRDITRLICGESVGR